MPINLTGVSYIYLPGTPYERTALQNITLEIGEQEFVAVIGHTGSGKSTLMQHLNGLLKPTAGRVTVDGVDLQAREPASKQIRRQVGLVFQYPEHQLFAETVYEDIAFGPRNLGLEEPETARRVKRAMSFVGLPAACGRRSPFQLSGGQMRRVAIAGVIALEPKYLILDEPSAGLDPRGREELHRQLKNLHRTTGITVIMVSHNMEEVAALASRLIVMQRGRVILDDCPRQVFKQERLLREAGLDIPGVTSLLQNLKRRGLAVDEAALTIDEAVATITAALRGRKPC